MSRTLRLLSAAVAVSSLSHAEPATRVSRPRFSALPVAELPKAPDASSAPSAIPKTERVEGFEVSAAQIPARSIGARRSRGLPSLGIPRTTTQAQAVLTIKQAREACSSGFPGQLPSPAPRSLFSSAATANVAVRSGVHPFRYERLVRAPERVYLEVVDIWVDSKTEGTRVHERSEVALALLTPGPHGIQVFGFRDSQHVWVVTSVPERGAAMSTRNSGISVCGHVRIGLKLGTSGSATNVLIGVNGERAGNESIIKTPFNEVPLDFSAIGIAASVSRLSRDSEPLISITISPAAPQLKRALASAVPRVLGR